jgi:short subunit dehydrogenase-like uncharacterized protein
MTLAILGVTGYTGRLVLDEARRAGLPLRLVGRRQDALNALARPGEEVRVADARSLGTLREAFAGASVVASCAGPFLGLGTAPVEAALAEGAHYLDTTGEQAFVKLVHERLGDLAAAAGVVALPAFGFDYVPGDLAARLAAEQVEGPLEAVVVARTSWWRCRRYAAASVGRSGTSAATATCAKRRSRFWRTPGWRPAPTCRPRRCPTASGGR